jgi:large subunit ribosomal protein L3
MAGFILGTKHNQSQMFDPAGNLIPVTKIETSPCYLVNIQNNDSKGFATIQIGFGTTKRVAKPVAGHLAKAGIKTPLRFLKEAKISNENKEITVIEEEGKKGLLIGEQKIFIGEEVKPTFIFKEGDIIHVSGTSKGQGFQGVVKRHNFRGGPRTHGQSDRLRSPGSIGTGTTPGRVYKGKRMAGRTGGERVTVQNLIVMQADEQSVTIKGLIPGKKGGLIEIRSKGL